MICSCDGRARRRAQQPVAPGARLVVVAGVHQRKQRQRRVAQPAEAIVPVATAAEHLRQRCRRRRDDAAGGRVGQRLERDQRARHRFGPLAVFSDSARPTPSRSASVLSRDGSGSIASGGGDVRRSMSENERNDRTFGDVELGHALQVLAVQPTGECSSAACRGRRPRTMCRRRAASPTESFVRSRSG